MCRAQYRNFGGWQTLVTSHSVDVGSDRAGARWYSIEKIGAGDWRMHDQGTYAPDDGLNRWMPSAAMDKSGDIAVGYSTSNGTAPNYPSIRYAARLATDPPGSSARGELIAGTGSQTGTASRWGDYSGMSVDPVDDCTFCYTTEYIQTTGATTWRTGSAPSRSRRAARRRARLRRRLHRLLRLRLHRLRRLRPATTRSRRSTGTIVPGTTDLGIHCDDCWRHVTFPFPVTSTTRPTPRRT